MHRLAGFGDGEACPDPQLPLELCCVLNPLWLTTVPAGLLREPAWSREGTGTWRLPSGPRAAFELGLVPAPSTPQPNGGSGWCRLWLVPELCSPPCRPWQPTHTAVACQVPRGSRPNTCFPCSPTESPLPKWSGLTLTYFCPWF